MWVPRRWLVLPSHFPLVLLEPRERMKEQQQAEGAQESVGEEQGRPVSREGEQSGPKKVWKWRGI